MKAKNLLFLWGGPVSYPMCSRHLLPRIITRKTGVVMNLGHLKAVVFSRNNWPGQDYVSRWTDRNKETTRVVMLIDWWRTLPDHILCIRLSLGRSGRSTLRKASRDLCCRFCGHAVDHDWWAVNQWLMIWLIMLVNDGNINQWLNHDQWLMMVHAG